MKLSDRIMKAIALPLDYPKKQEMTQWADEAAKLEAHFDAELVAAKNDYARIVALKNENDRLRAKLRSYGRQISEDAEWEDALLTEEDSK